MLEYTLLGLVVLVVSFILYVTFRRNDNFDELVRKIKVLAEIAVSDTNQHYVDELKKRDSFGPDEARHAREMGLHMVLKMLTKKDELALERNIKDPKEFIGGMLEDRVRKQKDQ